MSQQSYERQQLALWAAAYINAAGTTLVAFGCSMVKSSADGKYYLTFDAGSGLVPDEIFMNVQARHTEPRFVTDTDFVGNNTTKEIYVWGSDGVATDSDIEVAVYRSVTK